MSSEMQYRPSAEYLAQPAMMPEACVSEPFSNSSRIGSPS